MIAELLFGSASSTSSSLLSRRSLNFRRGQQFVLHEEPGVRRRSRLNLGRLYRSAVRSEVAGIGTSLNGGTSSGSNDIKLLGYQKIVDDSLECIEVEESKPAVNGGGNEERRVLQREVSDIDGKRPPRGQTTTT